ncbi:Brp/Blh family beta-carotene 15,15'-dioxygenase [Veronia pacifica]|uniref:Beta-carotene 15,15'-dioxygenase n=1 Tax=Veronia pacifica TaxID=1080227 RepID=A0A1C3EIE6_9GAMM|nr:Brp/Blh family beta-carotene 15,15'-dioxygenase [Veronia pacifica]ODA33000.1 hypothetical protein A8L45_11940 [Veronia pacifica]
MTSTPTKSNSERTLFIFPVIALVMLLAIRDLSLVDQTLISAVLIVLLGLPHGAMDLPLSYHLKLWKNLRGLLIWLTGYVALTLLCLAIWFLNPVLGLSIFFVITFWHFGADWPTNGNVERMIFGIWVICLPVPSNPGATREIFQELYQFTAYSDSASLMTTQVLCAGALITSPYIAYRALSHFYTGRPNMWLLDAAILLFAANTLPIILYFLLYFCSVHSPRHFFEIVKNTKLTGVMLSVVALTTLATVLLAAILWFSLEHIGTSSRLIHTVFAGLFALTVPHMVIVHLFEKTTLSQPSQTSDD